MIITENKLATELKAYNICNQTVLITLFIDITIRQPAKFRKSNVVYI